MAQIKPELVEHESLLIHGFSSRTCNQDESRSMNAKIPKLWESFASSPLKNALPKTKAYCVYSNYESDVSGFYDVTVGIPLLLQTNENHLTPIVIQKGHYFCFRNQGNLPDVVIETWNAIWQFFSEHQAYRRAYQTDFEVYLENNIMEVYIGLSTWQ